MVKFFNICMVIALLAVIPVSASADDAYGLSGQYDVVGWNPGSDPAKAPDYTGWAELKKWGEGWKYRAFMDNTDYLGVGLLRGKCKDMKRKCAILAVSFRNLKGTESGITVFRQENNNLIGQWIFDGMDEGKLGTEIWTKKK